MVDVDKRHVSTVYNLTGSFILLYGFYNMENGLYSVGNVGTAAASLMIIASLVTALLFGGNNYDIIFNSVKKPKKHKYTLGLWLTLLVSVVVFVSGVILLNHNPYNNFQQECEELEYLKHVPGQSPKCAPCNDCNYDVATCNPKTGACVCDNDGADPTLKCDACFDGFSIESNCTQCRNHYSTSSFCTKCQVGWNKASDCTTCEVGWQGEHCDECALGYFGNPSVSCEPCECEFGTCDSNTLRAAEFDASVCTRTAQTCSASSDCGDSGNCAGVCRSQLQAPGRAEVEEYENKVCRSDSDCGNDVEFYYGECVEKVCCKEYKYGTGDCLNCPDGRKEPRCTLCPGYDSTYDTYCNGHGTCIGTSNGAVCGCETGYSGLACQRGPDYTCVSGFYGTTCEACPGVTNLNGLSACNIKSGNAKECDHEGNCVCASNKYYKFDPATNCTTCMPGYGGENCLRCPGWEINDVDGSNVCGGHGTCIADEFGRPICECDEGYLIDAYLSCVSMGNVFDHDHDDVMLMN